MDSTRFPLLSIKLIVTPERLVSPTLSLSSSDFTLPDIFPGNSSTKSFPLSVSPADSDTVNSLSLLSVLVSLSVSKVESVLLSNSLTSSYPDRFSC